MERTYDNPHEMWLTVTKHFLNNDSTLIPSRDYRTSSIPIVSIIKHPTTKVQPNPKYSQEFADNYVKQMCDGDSDGDFVYTYHERLFNYKGINQIDYIIKTLKENPESRRAIAITWQPDVDENLEDVPCLQHVLCTLDDTGYANVNFLNMTAVFRSHDMFLGLPMNAIGLSGLMEKIAKELNAVVGTLTIVSLNAHVYIKRDIDDMRNFVNNFK